jgi:hypothetical protein
LGRKRLEKVTAELTKRLDEFYKRHPVAVRGPVGETEVARLEEFAGFTLPPSYKSFVTRYGAAFVGSYPIYGVGHAYAMAKNEGSAQEATEYFRAQQWTGINNWLIISTNLSGSPIGLTSEGEVYISDHEFGVVERIAVSFDLFLSDVCFAGTSE